MKFNSFYQMRGDVEHSRSRAGEQLLVDLDVFVRRRCRAPRLFPHRQRRDCRPLAISLSAVFNN
jgi:hypothetical protein